jgi:hypothetical protein
VQGSRLLRLFLNALKIDAQTDQYSDAEVQTDSSIQEGRLDILVKTTRLQLMNRPGIAVGYFV